jgi:hypothetical protein
MKMPVFERTNLMKIHMLLAAFMLPVALMFLVTGGLYTWGIKGGYETTSIEVTLDKPMEADEEVLKELVRHELEQRQIGLPSGDAGIRKVGDSFQFEWTGSNLDVVLGQTANPLVAKMQVKETDLHRRFVQLHKAKGGSAFKVYAAVLATALFILLVSGFILAWQLPKYRKMTAIATAAGIGVFIAMVLGS